MLKDRNSLGETNSLTQVSLLGLETFSGCVTSGEPGSFSWLQGSSPAYLLAPGRGIGPSVTLSAGPTCG